MVAAKHSTTLTANWTYAQFIDAIRDLFVNHAGFSVTYRDTINTRITSLPASAVTWERVRLRLVNESGAHGDLGLTFYAAGDSTTTTALQFITNVSSNNHNSLLLPEASLHNAANNFGTIWFNTAFAVTHSVYTTSGVRITLYRHNASPAYYFLLNITSLADASLRNDFQVPLVAIQERSRYFTALGLDNISPWIYLKTSFIPSTPASNSGISPAIGGQFTGSSTAKGKPGHNTVLGRDTIVPVFMGLMYQATNNATITACHGNGYIGACEPEVTGRILIRKNLAFRCIPNGGAQPLISTPYVEATANFGVLHPDLICGPALASEGYRLVVQTGIEEYELTHARSNSGISNAARGFGPQLYARMI